MADQGRPRGRGALGRAKARGTPVQQQASQAWGPRGPTLAQSSAAPTPQAWATAPTPAQAQGQPSSGQPQAWGKPQGQGPAPSQAPQQQQVWGKGAAQAPTARGRALQQKPPQPRTPTQEEGAVALSKGVGEVTSGFRGLQIAAAEAKQQGHTLRRGALRGRTEMVAPICTKPATMDVKKGSGGKEIKVITNHFKLVKTTDWSLYQYRVDFSPDEDRTFIRKSLLRDHKTSLLRDAYIFDGTMLFTIFRLQPDPVEVFSKRTHDQENIRITIKFTNELAMGDYQYIQLFNIILRNCIDSMKFQLVGREYFDPSLKTRLNDYSLEIWPGFVTSILQFEHNIMMCIDVSHKVLRQDTVLELMRSIKEKNPHDWQDKFVNAVLGAVVFTHYNNKPYRVDDIDFDQNPRSTFPKKDTQVSYIDYYWNKYQIRIKDLEQPLIVSRPRAKDIRGGRNQNVVLIPELCNMTGLTTEMRSNFSLMKAVADKTRIPPAGRIKSYYDFMNRMKTTQEVVNIQRTWNMMFAQQLEEVPARRLDPETLFCGGNRDFSYDESGDWARQLRGCSMLLSVKLYDWVLIYPPSMNDRRNAGLVQNFLQELKKAAKSLRFEMAEPSIIVTDSERASAYYSAIDKGMSRQNLQLVMCIAPGNRADVYCSIKKKCCVERPVASQVVATRTLNHKNLLSIATKIVIQMNCKLGGSPWYTPIPFRREDQKSDPTMVVGFDVCHDTATKGRSYGAIVASLDYYFTRFYSAVSQHSFGEELSNDIATHIFNACVRFRELNGHYPTRIIIYRDGVGESNIPFVLDHEIKMIEQRLKEAFPEAVIKMVVVIVSKRIQTRFFVQNENPKPGTIVDDVITQPERYDFFLVSQSVRQGTVTPTSYNVIYDTTALKPTLLQRITYKMTHLYYNCSATVRVPAQVQYAHKLAFLVGQALHQSPSFDLNGLLYFL